MPAPSASPFDARLCGAALGALGAPVACAILDAGLPAAGSSAVRSFSFFAWSTPRFAPLRALREGFVAAPGARFVAPPRTRGGRPKPPAPQAPSPAADPAAGHATAEPARAASHPGAAVSQGLGLAAGAGAAV